MRHYATAEIHLLLGGMRAVLSPAAREASAPRDISHGQP